MCHRVGLLVLSLLTVTSTAVAAPASSESPGDELPLLPSPGQVRAHGLRELGDSIADTIERLPHVRTARVHLAMPDPTKPMDDPPRPPKAAVSIVSSGPGPDTRAIRQLVAGAVDGLQPDQVTVLNTSMAQSAEPQQAGSTLVGPFEVAPSSASALRWTLSAGLALHSLLALALILLLRRARRREAATR